MVVCRLSTVLHRVKMFTRARIYEGVNEWITHAPGSNVVGCISANTSLYGEYGDVFVSGLYHHILPDHQMSIDSEYYLDLAKGAGSAYKVWGRITSVKQFVTQLNHRRRYERGKVLVQMYHPYISNYGKVANHRSSSRCRYECVLLRLVSPLEPIRYWMNDNMKTTQRAIIEYDSEEGSEVFDVAYGCFEQNTFAPLFDYVHEKDGWFIPGEGV